MKPAPAPPAVFCAALACFTLFAPAPAPAALYGSAGDGNLYTLSTADASATLVGRSVTFVGLDYRASDGQLYGFAGFDPSQLIRADPATGAWTIVYPLGANVSEGGMAIAPDGNTAYGVAIIQTPFQPQLFTLDIPSGNRAVVGALSGGEHDVNGLVLRADGQLVGLDRITNSLVVIDPRTAATRVLAAVPSNVGVVGGMAYEAGSYYYATGGPGFGEGAGSNTLYRFDPFTGASTPVGPITGLSSPLGIFALAGTVPEPSATFLAAAPALLLRRRRRRRRLGAESA